jgi:signal transduction histidine kinase
MKIFKSELTLVFDESDLEILYTKKTKHLFKYKSALYLSIIFTILLSGLIIFDAFPTIINKSFSFAAINLILIVSFGIFIYHKTKQFYSFAFYTLLIQLIVLKVLFGYVPSTYMSLIECIPFFINSLPVGYYYIAIIIILRITLNILLITFNRFTGIAEFLNEILVNVLLILVFYFYTRLSKQALFYKHKFKKRREIFENIFNNVNIGFIEFKKNKVTYVNKYVLDVLNKVNSDSKFKDLNINEKEKITEAIFSFFFDSKFEEEDVSTIDFRKLDICRNDEFRLLGNRILSIFNIDLIEFEIWGKKIKSDNYIILLKECTNVNNLQEEIKKQLKFKSSYLSKVAHELENPLISISELVEQLCNNRPANYSLSKAMGTEVSESPTSFKLPERDRNILEEIKVYLKYLMLLIKDLSYNVNDDFELSKCDLNSIISFIQSVTQCLIRKYNKDLSLKFKINIDNNQVPKFVITYEDGLKQILMNLITNAIKNTSSGTISLNITKQDDSNIKFQVDDTGMGFQLHNSRDFKQFTNNHQLGLYIIYDLTSKLGGTIQYTSVVNKGSSFWFTIPIKCDTPILTKKKYLNEFSEDERESHLEAPSNIESSYNESEDSYGSCNSICTKETVKLDNLIINYHYDSQLKKILVYNIAEFINYTQTRNDETFIIIVDDEKMARLSKIRLFSEVAEREGKNLNILEAEDGIECLYYLFLCNKKGIKVSAIFSDQTMNYLDGSYILSILNKLVAKKAINSIPFYIITAYEDEGTLLVLRDTLPQEIYTKPLKRKIVEKIIKELYKK